MTQPRITIIGLGLIGGSLGLALKAAVVDMHVVGHDADRDRSKRALKMGAVDTSTRNLSEACQDADLVVVTTPITAIRETLAAIGPHLKPGCVVTDTATLKEPVLTWAAETLPAGISFVGGAPTLNPAAQPDEMPSWDSGLWAPLGLESARADLFQDAPYVLCPLARATPAAVKHVTNMIDLIQARPFYVDPLEHDGMRATVEGLPALIGLALMQQAAGSPSWREARKLADRAFGMTTAPLDGDAAMHSTQTLLNAPQLVSCLDALLGELKLLRDRIQAQDAAMLEAAFEQAALVRSRWLTDRALAEWDQESAAPPAADAARPMIRMLVPSLRKPRKKR